MRRDIDPGPDTGPQRDRGDPRPDGGTPGGDPLPDPVGDLLAEVDLVAFAATPDAVAPLDEAELRWQVDAPDAVAVLLDGEPVGRRGTRTVSPHRTHTYTLAATAGRNSRQLGTTRVTVEVDGSDCYQPGLSNTFLAAGVLAQVKDELEGNARVSLRGDGGSAEVVDGGVEVEIPMNVDVPNWFDADTDVHLRFSVWTEAGDRGQDVRTALDDAAVDVSWHFLEHAASLGCTDSVQAALQELLHALIQDLYGPAWAGNLADGIRQNFVANRIRQAERDDDRGRQFALYELELRDSDDDTSVLTVCPI